MLMDLYTLAVERSAALVNRFLDQFLPCREKRAVEYEIPQYSRTPEVVCSTPEEAVNYCCSHIHSTQSIYWLNTDGDRPHSAHLFFLEDGGLILGLSAVFSDAEMLFDELLKFSGSVGLAMVGAPPDSTRQFREFSEHFATWRHEAFRLHLPR